MDWYHLDTSQLKCIHSMWELCWIVEQLSSYSPFCECITVVALYSYGAHAMACFPWGACMQTKGFMSLMEGVVWPIQLDILQWYAVVLQELSSWAFVIMWVLCWVLFLLWHVRHVVALPKIIQCPCLVSSDDAYMGACYKYHLMDASMSLLWLCWIFIWWQTAFCWILKFFMATDSFV